MNKTILINFLVLITGAVFGQTIPSVKWSYDVGAPAFGSAAAADLDGDGKLEIVFTTYTNDGKVHCLNSEDGSVLWTYDIGGCGDVAPIIYDLDGDDTLDVFVNGSCNPMAYCINGHTGALKWSVYSGGGDSPPTIADIDNDGKPEIIFGNFAGQLRILNGEDGSLAKSIQVTTGALQTDPVLCDVNGDGHLDIIVANHFNITGCYTYCYDYASGDTLWVNFMADTVSTYYSYHGGALADIDNDGKLEYVIGANNGTIRALNVEDGSVLWTVSGLTSVMSAITIADLDGNDTLEVIYNNNDYLTFNDHIGVLHGPTGQLRWSFPLIFSSFRGMAVSDINGNGKLDLVSGHYMGDVLAVEPFTGEIWRHNLLQYFPTGSTLPWFNVDHGPLIADFDGDGIIEVFVVAGYGTYFPDSTNVGKAFMLNAGTGYCPSWLMFRHDIHRTAYLPKAEVEQWCDTTTIVSTEVVEQIEWELQVMPNPFTIQAQIFVHADEIDREWTLEIFDVQGRLIERQVKSGHLGIQFDWNSSAVSVGVYYYRISSGMGSKSGKLLKMKL